MSLPAGASWGITVPSAGQTHWISSGTHASTRITGAPPVYLPHAGTSKSNCKNSTSGYRSSLVARLCTVSHQTPRWVLQIGAFAALGPVLEIIEELRARGVARHPQHQSAIGAGDRLGRRRHNGVLARGSEARGILARETSAIPRNGDSLVGSNVFHRSLTTGCMSRWEQVSRCCRTKAPARSTDTPMLRATILVGLALLAFEPRSAKAQAVPNRWDCFCEGRPCSCTPRPPEDPRLCDIICPPNTRFVPNCSCEQMTPDERRRAAEQERRRREDAERLEQERRAQERKDRR